MDAERIENRWPGRELGSFETAAAITAEASVFNLVVVARLAGPVREADLEISLATIQRRHPLLGVRIEGRGRRYFFAGVGDPIPLRIEKSAGADDWQAAAEEELITPFEGPLARVRMFCSPRRPETELVLCLHHAIVDGTSAFRILVELVRMLSGDAAPKADEIEISPLAPPADEFRPAPYRGLRRLPRVAGFMGRQLGADLIHRWRTRRSSPATLNPGAKCRILSFELDREVTHAVVRKSRRSRVTLNSALYAAALLSLSGRRQVEGVLPMRFFVFPELRRYLEPPVEADIVGGYLTVQRFGVDVDAEKDMWTLAAAIDQELQGAFRRGDKFLSHLTLPTIMRVSLRPGAPRMGDLALSYTGPVDLPADVESRLVGLHAFVSNPYQGPELAAQVRLFAGRLSWDLVYLDTDMEASEAQQIADRISHTLSQGGE